MFSTVIDTAIGLVFLFFLVAMLCSALTESMSAVMQMRARFLLTGLRAMLDKPETQATTPLLVGNAPATASTTRDISRKARKELLDKVRDPETTGAVAAAVNDIAVYASRQASAAAAWADVAARVPTGGSAWAAVAAAATAQRHAADMAAVDPAGGQSAAVQAQAAEAAAAWRELAEAAVADGAPAWQAIQTAASTRTPEAWTAAADAAAQQPGAAPADRAAWQAILAAITAQAAADKVPAEIEGLTEALFAHPLIQSQLTRRTLLLPWKSFEQRAGSIRVPQYLSPRTFTRSLVDTLLPDAVPQGETPGASVLTELALTVEKLPAGLPARKSITTLLRQADGDMHQFEASVERWYDDQMQRISGSYKRWAKVVLGITGLIVAVVVNVDSLAVARDLFIDEPLRQTVVAQATSGGTCSEQTDPQAQRACVSTQLAALKNESLPIGWPGGQCSLRNPSHCFLRGDQVAAYQDKNVPISSYVIRIVGWALTALAASFGAPFWFDLLGRLGSFRASGPKPAAAV